MVYASRMVIKTPAVKTMQRKNGCCNCEVLCMHSTKTAAGKKELINVDDTYLSVSLIQLFRPIVGSLLRAHVIANTAREERAIVSCEL
jgi:hypothetical protein